MNLETKSEEVMKKMKIFVSILFLAGILVSCTEAENLRNETLNSDEYILSLNFDAGYFQAYEGTKATMDAVIRASWEAGDKVSVINVSEGKLLGGQLVAQSSGYTVEFSGTITGTLTTGDKLAYVYPAIKENATEEAFTESVQDLSNQTYDSNSKHVAFYGYCEDVFSSATISKKIVFNLASSYVHLNMSGLPASTPVSTVSVSNINGGLMWAIEDGDFRIKPCMVGSSINVSCTGVTSTSASGNAIIHFAVPKSSAADARTLSVNNTLTTAYTAAERKPSSYYNQLYANWQNKVTVMSDASKTIVDINDSSTESVTASLGTSSSFLSGHSTDIQVGGLGTITFDATATDKILSNANSESATNLFFKVENVTEKIAHGESEVVYEVTMKTVDESGTEVFSETKAAGTATVAVALPEAQPTPKPKVYLSSGGVKGPEIDASRVDFTDGILSFSVEHFSEYAIEYTKYAEYVAVTDNRKYPALSAAIEAAKIGNTVEIIKDITLDAVVSVNKDIKLKSEYTTTGTAILNVTGGAAVSIFSGTYNGSFSVTDPGRIVLYGGTYSFDPSAVAGVTVPFGYKSNANGTTPETWTVSKNTVETAEVSVVKAGVETMYASLAEFRDATNAGSTFAGYTITLLVDIDLNNTEWVPISNYAYGAGSGRLFAGTFDGGNHTISNLKISANTSDALGNTNDVANGFFGQVATCTIKNLKFENANVSGAGLNAIVASLHTVSTGKLLMKNVHVLSGSVTNTSNAGGLMSYSIGWADFEDCVNYASVSGYGTGGIVGILRDNTQTNTCTIKNCTNYGSVTNTVGGGDGAGGIVSKMQYYSSIINCKNYGAVSGTVGNVYAGGIIGITGGDKTVTITDCINYASVTSNAGDYGRAGGIIGKFAGAITISRCINTGNITGYQGAGGINGWSGDSWGMAIYHSYNSGAIVCSNGTAGGIDQGNANQTVGYSLNNGSVSSTGGTAWKIANSSSTVTSCYYYEASVLKDNSGTAADADVAITALNSGLETPFWGKDSGTIKPIALIP